MVVGRTADADNAGLVGRSREVHEAPAPKVASTGGACVIVRDSDRGFFAEPIRAARVMLLRNECFRDAKPKRQRSAQLRGASSATHRSARGAIRREVQ